MSVTFSNLTSNHPLHIYQALLIRWHEGFVAVWILSYNFCLKHARQGSFHLLSHDLKDEATVSWRKRLQIGISEVHKY